MGEKNQRTQPRRKTGRDFEREGKKETECRSTLAGFPNGVNKIEIKR